MCLITDNQNILFVCILHIHISFYAQQIRLVVRWLHIRKNSNEKNESILFRSGVPTLHPTRLAYVSRTIPYSRTHNMQNEREKKKKKEMFLHGKFVNKSYWSQEHMCKIHCSRPNGGYLWPIKFTWERLMPRESMHE